MTLYTLAALPPDKLDEFLTNGTVHPRLARKAAERLVRQHRGSNSNGGRQSIEDHSGCNHHEVDHQQDEDHDDCDDGHDHDLGHGRHDDRGVEHLQGGPGEDQLRQDECEVDSTPSTRDDVGPNSRLEIERKLARLEELERERGQWNIARLGFESEVAELRGKLGAEIQLRHQCRLFRRALEQLQKSDTPKLIEKDRRALVNGAVTDLLELVRSLARDGLALERIDLFCRVEVRS
jgi:hypothetical protein